jgi:hypothetical protein
MGTARLHGLLDPGKKLFPSQVEFPAIIEALLPQLPD